jgi:hypothetical protein
MSTYALIQNGVVVNLVLWDGVAPVEWPEGTTVIAHDGLAHIGWLYDGAKFVDPNPPVVPQYTLDDAKTDQRAALSAACQAEIVGGFPSSATGQTRTYPTKLTDQQNLNSSVVASLIPGIVSTWVTPFWCADVNGNWSYVYHTANQIQKVGQDIKAQILSCQAKNEQLQAQVMAATTIEQVQSIKW